MPAVANNRSLSLALYLREISEYRQLAGNRERAIAESIPESKRGAPGAGARDDLIKANLGFVVKIAREYSNMGLPFEDLLGEGNLGLIEAARHFDPERGTKFITYAVWWIRKSILKALSRHGAIVRIPSYQLKKVRRVQEAGRHLAHRLGRGVDREEICRELSTNIEKLDEILQIRSQKLSLEDRVGRDKDSTIASRLIDNTVADPEAALIEADNRRHIRAALRILNDRDLTVIANRFGLEDGRMFTLREIGGKLGVTRERVRQIESEARARLRRAIVRPLRAARARAVDRGWPESGRRQAFGNRAPARIPQPSGKDYNGTR